MKKCFTTLLVLLFLVGCTSKTPLENIEDNYSKETAIQEDCVVVYASDFENGRDDWMKFMTHQINKVRLVNYDYISEVRMDRLCDIEYKNQKYTITYNHEGKLYSEEYNYLLADEYDGMTYYYLDNDQESYKDTFKKALSSSLDAFSFRWLFKIKNG